MSKSSIKWVLTMLTAAVVIALAMAGGYWQTGRADSLPTTPTNGTVPISGGSSTIWVNQQNASVTLQFSPVQINNIRVKWVFTPAPNVATISNNVNAYGSGATSGYYTPVIDSSDPNYMKATVTIDPAQLQEPGTLTLSMVNNFGGPDQVEFGEWTINITGSMFLPIMSRFSIFGN